MALPDDLAAFASSAADTSAQKLATSGFKKLPGGLILQWGNVSIPGGADNAVVTLPTPFVTGGYSYVASDNSNAPVAISTNAIDAASFRVRAPNTTARTVSWIALGL